MGEFINRTSSSGSFYRQSSTNAYRKSRTEFEGNNSIPNRDTNLQPVRENESSVF